MFNELSVSENVHKYRKNARLSQNQLSEKAGVSRTFISDLERGANKLPSINILCRLAEALNISVDNLIQDTLTVYAPSDNDSLSKEIAETLHCKSERDLQTILSYINYLAANGVTAT